MSIILFEINGLEAFGDDADMIRPINYSEAGECFDDNEPIYSNQIHLSRPLSAAEYDCLKGIEPQFDCDGDGDFIDGKPSDDFRAWLNFDYFSDAARAYLDSLPDEAEEWAN